jgi:hypothetical protein
LAAARTVLSEPGFPATGERLHYGAGPTALEHCISLNLDLDVELDLDVDVDVELDEFISVAGVHLQVSAYGAHPAAIR